MANAPSRPFHWSRRKLILAGGGTLLAAPAFATTPDPMRRILCPEQECGYRYNPAVGDPDFGVPPGTPFDDLPDDWECPECGTHIRYW